MPARTKKVKRFVIDVNTYISIFINRQTNWFQNYAVQNSLEFFIDDQLIEELNRVLDYLKIKVRLHLNKADYIGFVRSTSTFIEAEDHQIKSPDPEDNYLYNVALTAKTKLLVAGGKSIVGMA